MGKSLNFLQPKLVDHLGVHLCRCLLFDVISVKRIAVWDWPRYRIRCDPSAHSPWPENQRAFDMQDARLDRSHEESPLSGGRDRRRARRPESVTRAAQMGWSRPRGQQWICTA